MDLLNGHWERNKEGEYLSQLSVGVGRLQHPHSFLLHRLAREREVWSTGNIYVNHWKSPTYMVSVENTNLRGGGIGLKRKIWQAVQPVIEEWTGMELQPTSQYGIRIYTEGAILSPHVDRLPLVSSCIINVAQDVDEPWPLEVINRQGRAVNVTMDPGDMVLYESGSLIHARPFPLKGRYFANIFIHFEPTGRPLNDHTNAYLDTLDHFFPPYIQPGSPWADHWAQQNPNGWKKPAPSAPKLHSTIREPHVAAATGDIERLQEIADKDPKALHRADENGWHPLHESVRAGHNEVAELLIMHGADKNARTGRKKNGQSPLTLALYYHGEDAPIVEYLRSVGAEEIDQDEL